MNTCAEPWPVGLALHMNPAKHNVLGRWPVLRKCSALLTAAGPLGFQNGGLYRLNPEKKETKGLLWVLGPFLGLVGLTRGPKP